MMNLVQLLKFAVERGASDVHISSGTQPGLRINGAIVRVKMDEMGVEHARRICYSVLNDEQKKVLEEGKEIDFSFEIRGIARFRANYFYQKNTISGVFRQVPEVVPRFDSLGLPNHLLNLTDLPNGLILVTGPTGSGKSTTIASMLDRINQDKSGHIVTLEDPIEYMHSHGRCVVSQREVGHDTMSFKRALKSLMRQDPDYCLIGELRDLETIETALQLAETGHLVFATLHTNSSVQTINRIVSIFPSEQQDRIRIILSFVLQAVICQKLIPSVKGGRAAAYEVLTMTTGIRNLIRENKIHQIESMMQVGQKSSGMNTLNQCLFQLVTRGQINKNYAMAASTQVDNLVSMFRKAGV